MTSLEWLHGARERTVKTADTSVGVIVSCYQTASGSELCLVPSTLLSERAEGRMTPQCLMFY